MGPLAQTFTHWSLMYTYILQNQISLISLTKGIGYCLPISPSQTRIIHISCFILVFPSFTIAHLEAVKLFLRKVKRISAWSCYHWTCIFLWCWKEGGTISDYMYDVYVLYMLLSKEWIKEIIVIDISCLFLLVLF